MRTVDSHRPLDSLLMIPAPEGLAADREDVDGVEGLVDLRGRL